MDRLCREPSVRFLPFAAALLAGLVAIAANAAAFTKGRELAPLPPAFKPCDFVWRPEISPAGPVVIIGGGHLYSALAGVDAKGRRDWLATTSIGGGSPPNIKSLAALTTIPPDFVARVPPLIAPGTTLVLTELSASTHTRSKDDSRILTADTGP